MPPEKRRIRQGYGTGLAAAGCAAMFVAVLAVSAYWDRRIRLLHLFESVPYLAAGALCLRQSKFGYALGVTAGAFWLWMAAIPTTFVRNGFERLGMLVRTGSVDRLDILIAVPAACATAGLIVFSVAGYAGLPNKSWRDAGPMAAAMIVVPAFFVLIFAAFAPQYLGMFERVLK
jgi:hypothetical protein